MTDEITVDDVGQLFKTALTGTENERSTATKLLSQLPEYFNDIARLQKPEKKHIDLIKLFIALTCLIISSYFIILIIKEVKPKSIQEKKMECLKLGSDMARSGCLILLRDSK